MTTPYKWQGLEEDPRQQKASPVKQNVMATLVKCVPTSVQPGFKRFPNPHDRPHIKQWRCELTALSHRYNLYFVACNDTIHVYQPGFPNQRLSDEPDLILYPPVSPGDLDHGIDPYDPHSINRLLVDYLGREEIVLVVCDDGDVIGYRLDEIHRAIENRVISGNGEQEPIEGDSVRVFLHRNVGESAWGLAVHREARMIAISANTHEITVLAYALASPDPETEESDPSDCLRNEHDVEDFPVPRRRDHVFVLPAMANIPAVSFINNGTDPAGRWLSSNSIDGKTIVWDLHHPLRPGREIEVGCCVNVQDPTKTPGSCNCQHRAHVLHAAWNTIFLDPRSAHPSADIREAFGLASQDDEDLLKKPPCFRDITSSRERFKVRSNGMPFQIHHALNPIGQGDAPIEDESSDISLSDTGEEGDQEEEEQADEEDDDEQEEDEEETESIIVSGESPHSGSDNMSLDEQPEEESEANIPTAENQPELIVETANQHIVTLDQAALQVFEEESDDSDDEIFGVLPPSGHSQMDYVMGTRRPRFYYHVKDPHNLQESVPSPPTPCLIVTKDEIYLLQRPLGHPPWMKETIITMRKPLHPGELDFRPSLLPLPHQSFDRQCFSSQISELGVFIIATPAGRVGIFSFTQVKSSQTPTSTFGFRLEYLLPFSKSDEHIIEGLPPMRLVGVAVGPVQGMLDELYQGDSESGSKPGEWDLRSRRWRLIMYFNDNTVLSYELSKRRECDSLSVGDLVV